MNVNVKYKKEARFAFGVALVMGNDGVKVGKRIPLFEYTERTILSRVDWKRKIREEIYRVKGLVNDGDWIVSSREGRYFREDELIMLKRGLGKKNGRKAERTRDTQLRRPNGRTEYSSPSPPPPRIKGIYSE